MLRQATITPNPPRHRFRSLLSLCACTLFAGGCRSFDSAPNPISPPTVVCTSSCDSALSNTAARAEYSEPVTVDVASSAHDSPRSTIDLETALQLAGMDSPTINLSREAVTEAAGRLHAAEVLLLPNLTVGGNFHQHRGNLQNSSGTIRNVDSQDLYVGLGARALAAETVAYPGIRIFSHLGDAIFEPLASRQNREARLSTAKAVENSTLLDVATAYFELLSAEICVEILAKAETELGEIVRLTTSYAKNGQGRAGDEHRAETNLGLLHRQMLEAEGAVAVASARLAGMLNLDSSVNLRTPGGAIQPLTLVAEGEPAAILISRALLNRPEVRAQVQEIALARTRLRQERTRPFLPTLSAGFSAGSFGGGSNLTAAGIVQPGGGVLTSPRFGRFDGRVDIDVYAVWTLQNAGMGNLALARGAQAVLGESAAELERVNNQIREQVVEALSASQAAERQMNVARKQLASAEEGYREEMTRIKQTVGRPLETLDSFRQLVDARQEIFRTVVAYNSAQYRLFVAVGMSPLMSNSHVCDNPVIEH